MTVAIYSQRIQRELGALKLDAVLAEKVSHSAVVTKFPVEAGAEMSDHIFLEPMIYTLKGVVSDYPLRWIGTSYVHADASTRALSAYAILREMHSERQPFEISATGFLRMPNMGFLTFDSERTPRNGQEFTFEATLQQLNIIELKTAQLTATEREAGQAADQAGEELDKGKQDVVAPDGTSAASLWDWFTSLGGDTQ